MSHAPIRGRYAPSPTGRLHLGNLRTALVAWLQVRLCGGVFILRMDDLDTPRNRPGAEQQILDDLYWLGIDWDEGPDTGGGHGPYRQSERIEFYRRAFARLVTGGGVFACSCSRKDIARAASAPHAGEAAPVYPGTCRDNRVTDAGRPPADPGDGTRAWRYRVGERSVAFVDQVMGEQVQDLAREVGDFVIRRRDGVFAYHLANVVDDQAMAVSDVLRGADLVDSTPRQIALMHELGFVPPRFWHVPLLDDDRGARMSKRDGSHSLEQWRAAGRGAEQLVGHLAHSVGLLAHEEALSAHDLLRALDPEKFRTALSRT